jgi:hypothetical protein
MVVPISAILTDLSLFSSVLSGKYRGSTLIRPSPLPSQSFPIHHSLVSLKYWQCRKLSHRHVFFFFLPSPAFSRRLTSRSILLNGAEWLSSRPGRFTRDAVEKVSWSCRESNLNF